MKEDSLIGSIDTNKPIRIYGAGISGLLIAYQLKKLNLEFEVHERSDQLGGKIGTQSTDSGLVETAANAIYTDDCVYELLDELKLDYLQANSPLKKKVWRNNKPSSPINPLKMILVIIKSLIKKVPTHKRCSVYDFFHPLLGKDFCNEVLSAALAGIYASSSDELDFDSLFKVTRSKNQSYFSYMLSLKKERSKRSSSKQVSISFANGMQEFVNTLKKCVEEHIHLSSSPQLSDKYNNIICTDAKDAAELTRRSYPKVSSLLDQISYKSLQTTTIFFQQSIKQLDRSFGVVVSPTSNLPVLGILNNSAIFNRARERDLYSYTFISRYSNFDQSKLLQDIRSLYFIKEEPINSLSTTWSKALPVYNHARSQIVNRLKDEVSRPGLVLFGNYTNGISIRDLIFYSKKISESI